MLRSKRVLSALLAMFVVSGFALYALAEDLPHVVVFYRNGCNDCRHMDELLDDLHDVYPGLIVEHIEENDAGAADLMWTLAAEYGIFPSAYPVIFAGNVAIAGVGREKELQLRSAVRECMESGCESPLERIQQKAFPWLTAASIVVALLVVAILLL